MPRRLLVWVLLCVLAGCSKDPITEFVNKAFPPVNVDQQRQTAIDTNATALSRLGTPNLALGVNFEDAQKALFAGVLKQQGVTKFEISGDKELLKLRFVFDRMFTGKDAPKDDNALAEKLDKLKPHVVGEIATYAGLSGEVETTDQDGIPTFVLRVLPSISTVSVSKVELAEKLDISVVGQVLTALLTRYKENIPAVLARAKLTSVKIPALSDKPIDVARALNALGPQTPGVQLVVSAQPVKAPFRLDGFAWLVTDKQLTGLLQLSPAAMPALVQAIPVEKSFEGVKKRTDEIVEQVLDVPDADSTTWVAVKKDVVASAMNSVVNQASACVSANADLPKQHFEQKVAMPSGAGMNCNSTRSCDPNRVCTFSANQDNRDCSACLLRAPRACAFGGCIGGQCTLPGLDPVCQLAKGAQQAAYNADANLRKADCDRLRETERTTCQAEMLAEKTLCLAAKTSLDALSKSGNFANLDVDATVKTDGAKVCLSSFALSPELDHIQFALDVTGSATAHVNLAFMPLDLGHAVCPIKWSKEMTLTGSLSDGQVPISSAITLSTDHEQTVAKFKVDKVDLKPKMRPGPGELLARSPDLMIYCPVMQFIAPVTVMLSPFIPPLQGDFTYSVPARDADVQIPPSTQKVGNRSLTLTPSTTKSALVVTAKVGDETPDKKTEAQADVMASK
jgi:hypothetical protein